MNSSAIDRRTFVTGGVSAGTVLGLGAWATAVPAEPATEKTNRVRVAVIGCGSVSNKYLPHLSKSPYVEFVSTCDIIPDRAQRQASRFKVPNHYPHIEKMLAGAPFDMMVTLTDMQEHEHLNREAIEAGKHVWSEKPIANSLAAGQAILARAREKGVQLWGAPCVVTSPQFAFMAKTLAAGALGRLAAAHADYGHTGPDWSAFFYEKGGGSMPDLGVYNLSSLTGLLGPAQAVAALTSIVTPTRKIRGKGEVRVGAEDNAMILLDHGNGVLSHTQCGFNYFNPHGHEGKEERRHTITIVGSKGVLGLVGYDWEPLGVDVATQKQPVFQRHATDAGHYVWEQGASLAAETLATGNPLLVTPEHALHVLEIMVGARQSQETGRRIPLRSTFKWPVVS